MREMRPEYRRRYRAAILWRERALGEKSPRGNTPLGDATTMHRDYVGVYEKRTSKYRRVARPFEASRIRMSGRKDSERAIE